MHVRVLVVAALAALPILAPSVAQADDHLFNGATSPGAAVRGFTNPVALNPSGTSGTAAQPATVPGLGDPNAGLDEGTPAFSVDTLCIRLDARSMGEGPC